jgi:hypothetical protein
MTNGLSRRGFLRALPLPDILLTEDAANPDGLLYRWKAPRSFKQRKGGLRELGPTDGVLGAMRCTDRAPSSTTARSGSTTPSARR